LTNGTISTNFFTYLIFGGAGAL